MISVLVPILNGEPFVMDCYESIKSQSHVTEIIFVDNGSTDKTLEVLRELAVKDSRVIVKICEVPGISAALNTGLGIAKNEYIARLDVDDTMTVNRCHLQLAFMQSMDLDICGTQIIKVDVNGRKIGDTSLPSSLNIYRKLDHTNPIYHPTVMFKKSIVLKSGGYRSRFDGAEDLDLWLKLLPVANFGIMPDKLVNYRVHPGQVTLKSNSFGPESRVRFSYAFKSFSPMIMKTNLLFPFLNLLKAFYSRLVSTSTGKMFHHLLRRWARA